MQFEIEQERNKKSQKKSLRNYPKALRKPNINGTIVTLPIYILHYSVPGCIRSIYARTTSLPWISRRKLVRECPILRP